MFLFTFLVGGQLVNFHKREKRFEPNFIYKKNVPLDGLTWQTKSTSQLVNFPVAQPLAACT